jgi:acyl-CoA thioester hydrolase
MGHMNVAAYLEKFDNATWNFFADNGLSRLYLESHGIGLAAVNQNITYKRELRAGDVITVRSNLMEIEGKKIRFRSIMFNGETGEEVAEIENLAVCLDISRRKACAFPIEIVEKACARLMRKPK